MNETMFYFVFGSVFAFIVLFFWQFKNKKNVEESASMNTSKNENTKTFSEKFVQANLALTKGNSEGLEEGLSLFIESLPYAGTFESRVVSAIKSLHGALSHHSRADQRGPWNRDLSGYGVISWKNDIYDRNTALKLAWEDISSINDELKRKGLGWHY